jgi:tetratricopeptide (TPR) repeat protein
MSLAMTTDGRVRNVAVLVSLFACLLFSGVASAQDGGADDVTAEDKRRAQEYFDQGAEHYVKGEYARAIVDFRKGYQRFPASMFLYNIALSEAKLGQCDKAAATARRAMRKGDLPAKTASSNAALERACSVAVEAGSVAESAAAVAESDQADEQVESEGVGRGSDGQGGRPPQREALAYPERSFGALGWGGVSTAGLGVGALVVSAVVTTQLQRDWESYEEAAANRDRQTFEKLRNDIPRKQTQGQVLLYAGAGLTAVGTAMIIMALSGPENYRPAAFEIAPGFSPRGGWTIQIERRF